MWPHTPTLDCSAIKVCSGPVTFRPLRFNMHFLQFHPHTYGGRSQPCPWTIFNDLSGLNLKSRQDLWTTCETSVPPQTGLSVNDSYQWSIKRKWIHHSPPPFYSCLCYEKSPPHIVSDLNHSEKRGFLVVDVIQQLKLMLKVSWSPYKV